jgi:hypothetical protein
VDKALMKAAVCFYCFLLSITFLFIVPGYSYFQDFTYPKWLEIVFTAFMSWSIPGIVVSLPQCGLHLCYRKSTKEDNVHFNLFSSFFLVLFILLSIVNLGLGFEFDANLKNDVGNITELAGKIWFFFVQLVLNFIIIGMGGMFFMICNDLEEGDYEFYAAYFVAILGAPLMAFISIFLVKGGMLGQACLGIQPWAIITIFFVNVFIATEFESKISGIFIVDVLIYALTLTVFSSVFAIGFVSIFVAGFHYPWSVLVIEIGALAVVARLFLWQHEVY